MASLFLTFYRYPPLPLPPPAPTRRRGRPRLSSLIPPTTPRAAPRFSIALYIVERRGPTTLYSALLSPTNPLAYELADTAPTVLPQYVRTFPVARISVGQARALHVRTRGFLGRGVRGEEKRGVVVERAWAWQNYLHNVVAGLRYEGALSAGALGRFEYLFYVNGEYGRVDAEERDWRDEVLALYGE
ncbi:MAG: hypothetical protein M1829_000223 [Trizodia sp. TS-e1964]|nr:MAG: hypothetical protein M1829_000223 [Trizodia sp. TS-e1964]